MTAKDKKTVKIVGAAVVGAGLLYLLLNGSEPAQEPQEETPKEPVINLPPAQLNRDKVLRKGQTNAEIKELQRMLNVNPKSGFFGNLTEAALLKTKGLREVSLNQFSNTPNVISVTPIALINPILKIGDVVEANSLKVAVYKNILDGSTNKMLNTVTDYYFFGQNIGKIVGFNAAKTRLLVQANYIVFSDQLVWVNASDVKRV